MNEVKQHFLYLFYFVLSYSDIFFIFYVIFCIILFAKVFVQRKLYIYL